MSNNRHHAFWQSWTFWISVGVAVVLAVTLITIVEIALQMLLIPIAVIVLLGAIIGLFLGGDGL